MRRLTAESVTVASVCPKCGKGNRLNMKAQIDSDQRIYKKWLVCGHCGWDQRGRAALAQSEEEKL